MSYKLAGVSESFDDFEAIRRALKYNGGHLGSRQFEPWDVFVAYEVTNALPPSLHYHGGFSGRGNRFAHRNFEQFLYGDALVIQIPNENGIITTSVRQLYLENKKKIYLVRERDAITLNPRLGVGEDEHDGHFILWMTTKRRPQVCNLPANTELAQVSSLSLETILRMTGPSR